MTCNTIYLTLFTHTNTHTHPCKNTYKHNDTHTYYLRHNEIEVNVKIGQTKLFKEELQESSTIEKLK